MRTAAASFLICAAGGALLGRGTDGFRAVTTEQARRVAIARRPREIPIASLVDQDGRRFTLDVYRGRPVAVEFIYTRCRSVCALLSSGFQRIDQDQRARVGRLPLLSISFDPRDTPETLREYALRYHADGEGWRFARAADAAELDALLGVFGIIVIPDRRGDFQHNAALHLVDANGKLARILSAESGPRDVARTVAELHPAVTP
jgi:protein SCO1